MVHTVLDDLGPMPGFTEVAVDALYQRVAPVAKLFDYGEGGHRHTLVERLETGGAVCRNIFDRISPAY